MIPPDEPPQHYLRPDPILALDVEDIRPAAEAARQPARAHETSARRDALNERR